MKTEIAIDDLKHLPNNIVHLKGKKEKVEAREREIREADSKGQRELFDTLNQVVDLR